MITNICFTLSLLALPSVFAERYASFLQRFESTQETSVGTLGEGLELIGGDISTLSSGLSKSFDVTDQQIDSTISIVSSYGSALTKAQIDSLERDLQSVQKSIKSLESELKTLKTCGDYASCSGCSSDSSCVWCETLQSCVAGSNLGPAGLECADFEYGSCKITGCDIYTQCDLCISDTTCKWCSNGNYCSENPKACEEDFVYSMEDNANCPAPKDLSSDSDIFVIEGQSVRSATDIQVELQEEYNQRDAIQASINALEDALGKIETDSKAAQESKTPDFIVDNRVKGLGNKVDQLYKEEIEDNRRFQEDLAGETTQEVVGGVDEVVKVESQGIETKIDESYGDLLGQIKEMQTNLDLELDELRGTVSGISDEVTQNELRATQALSQVQGSNETTSQAPDGSSEGSAGSSAESSNDANTEDNSAGSTGDSTEVADNGDTAPAESNSATTGDDSSSSESVGTSDSSGDTIPPAAVDSGASSTETEQPSPTDAPIESES